MNALAKIPANELSNVIPLHVPSISSKAAALALAALGHTPQEIGNYLRLDSQDVAYLYQDELQRGKTQLLLKLKQRMVERALNDGKDAQKAAEYLVNNLSSWGDKDKSQAGSSIHISTNGSEKPTINIMAVPAGQFLPSTQD